MATTTKKTAKTKTSSGSSSGASLRESLRKTAKKVAKKAAPKRLSAQTDVPKAAPAANASELSIYSRKGAVVGTAKLPAELFAAPWRPDLVHQVVTAIAANKRQNRAHTKDRSEVKGGGRKPWKQKGTGQARHGSTRSPIWRHGGVTFGPRTERDYHEKINRKMRAGALASVLSRKAKDGELILVDSFSLSTPKTKDAISALAAIGKGAKANLLKEKGNAALIAFLKYDQSAIKSFRNIKSIATEEVRNVNPLEILSSRYLVIENPEEAFKALIARIK
jgi:large subunit ribosomal protein L4